MTEGVLMRLVFHEADASDGFAGWLADSRCGLAVTNGNRLFLVGLRRDGSVDVVAREYPAASALAPAGEDGLFLATTYQIWRLQDALPDAALTPDGHDRLFVPQTAWTTGRIDPGQIVLGALDRPIVASTRFSCLLKVDDRLNFRPVWHPPFVSAVTPEGRCHLSGLALRDGEPAFATCAAAADTVLGWQAHRGDGGLVLAVPGGETVMTGLSMPHSPWLDNGKLWLANGGAGEVGFVEPDTGSYQCVAELPGFTRGLALHGRHAVVGVSRPPRDGTFDDLPLARRLSDSDARCGIFVVDVHSGAVEHRLLLHGVGPEINDLAFLECRWPTAACVQGEDVETLVTLPR